MGILTFGEKLLPCKQSPFSWEAVLTELINPLFGTCSSSFIFLPLLPLFLEVWELHCPLFLPIIIKGAIWKHSHGNSFISKYLDAISCFLTLGKRLDSFPPPPHLHPQSTVDKSLHFREACPHQGQRQESPKSQICSLADFSFWMKWKHFKNLKLYDSHTDPETCWWKESTDENTNFSVGNHQLRIYERPAQMWFKAPHATLS